MFRRLLLARGGPKDTDRGAPVREMVRAGGVFGKQAVPAAIGIFVPYAWPVLLAQMWGPDPGRPGLMARRSASWS